MDNEISKQNFSFPGKWLGGISLVVAPLLLLLGVLLRIPYHFFFPQQLEAFSENPLLMSMAYQSFLAGNILLWPGILVVVRQIGRSHPNWALWGGIMVIFGLFARTFHAGVDHLAFQLVKIHEVELATNTIGSTYGAFHIASLLTLFILLGWIVLAIGVYRSGSMNLWRSIALGMMSMLMIGILKGSSTVSVIATASLCCSLVPQGIQVLREGNQPGYGAVIRGVIGVICLIMLLYFIGQAG